MKGPLRQETTWITHTHRTHPSTRELSSHHYSSTAAKHDPYLDRLEVDNTNRHRRLRPLTLPSAVEVSRRHGMSKVPRAPESSPKLFDSVLSHPASQISSR